MIVRELLLVAAISLGGCGLSTTREVGGVTQFSSSKPVDQVAECIGEQWLAEETVVNTIERPTGYSRVSERSHVVAFEVEL